MEDGEGERGEKSVYAEEMATVQVLLGHAGDLIPCSAAVSAI